MDYFIIFPLFKSIWIVYFILYFICYICIYFRYVAFDNLGRKLITGIGNDYIRESRLFRYI